MNKKITLLFFISVTAIVFFLFFPVTSIAQQWGLYTLYATKSGTKAYLIDTADVPSTYHQWTFNTSKKSGYSAYLMPGDTLVRTYTYTGNVLNGGGMTGGVQKALWDGTVVWDYVYSSSTYCIHHDICPLPNGNVLMISYDVRTSAEATQAGCSTSMPGGIWSDKIIEVHPTGPTTGTIVWEWKLWDHLCQNYSSAKDNYVTSIVNNPQLMNINYNTQKDFWHMNGIDYNAALNQIVVSAHFMNSVFVIDHSTTTAEAAGHTGGNSGKGGDFIYRWGNPASYGATGTTNFNVVHDAHWVPSDNPNYPNYLAAYNNQGGTGGKTAIDIWNPPYSGNNYSLTLGQAYAPATYTYRYNTVFTATNEGNSYQLPNGNMLVNNFQGSIYEVNASGTTLWTKTAANSTHAYRYSKCYVRGPVASAGVSLSSICSGTQITLSSSAVSVTETSPAYSYSWASVPSGYTSASQNPSDIPANSTTYLVTITNTSIGCSDTAHVFVNVNSSPTTPTISQNENTLTSSTALTYQWYLNSVAIPGETNQNMEAVTDGTYQVEITEANGCVAISAPFSFIYTGITDVASNNSPVVFPNPTNCSIIISGSKNIKAILTNAMGAILESGENVNMIDLSEYSNGIYYIAITSENGLVSNQKIILIK